MSRPIHCLCLSLFLSLASDPVTAADPNVWEASINSQSKERYIPVELWTGTEWDGKRELRMPAVNGTYRHRTSTYYIKGPTDWKHPVTGQTSTVYERVNPDERRGEDKTQLFTINQDQTGLGRLFDGRPGRDTRTYSGGLKFTLGMWKEGESKPFTYKVWDTSVTERLARSPFSPSILAIRVRPISWKFIGQRQIAPAGKPTTDTLTSTAQAKAW